LALPGISHVILIVTNNRIGNRAAASGNLLHNVSKIINEKVENRASACNGSKKTIYLTYNVGENTGNVVDGCNEQRIQIQRLKNTVDDIGQMTQTYLKLQLRSNIGNGEIYFGD
jgi:hypothetical protein